MKRICIALITPAAFGMLLLLNAMPARAGTWQVTKLFSGTASTTFAPNDTDCYQP
jgi:hypothetical protein